MKVNKKILIASLFAFVGVVALDSESSMAETPSSPAEREATAKLNQDIADSNATADEHYTSLQKDYLQKKTENDELQREYQAKLEEYKAQEALYQQKKKEGDLLHQQYSDRLKAMK